MYEPTYIENIFDVDLNDVCSKLCIYTCDVYMYRFAIFYFTCLSGQNQYTHKTTEISIFHTYIYLSRWNFFSLLSLHAIFNILMWISLSSERILPPSSSLYVCYNSLHQFIFSFFSSLYNVLLASYFPIYQDIFNTFVLLLLL